MSSIKQSVRTRLLQSATITALVGANVFTGRSDQGQALPRINIQRISGGQEHDLDGAAANANPRIQIDCYAATDIACDTLADAVRNMLDGYTGVMGTHFVDVAYQDDRHDGEDAPIDGSDVATYRVTQDYFIRYTEPTPTFL